MSTTTKPSRRRLRWWQVLLLGLGGGLGLLAIFVALVLASIFGALDGLGGDPPREGDPEVVAARDESAVGLRQDAALASQSAVLPALPRGSAVLAQGEVTPPCQEGQHNWKIDDDFDLACSQARREVVAVPTRSSFRQDMVALDETLRDQGWQPSFQPIPDVLTGYWDPLAGEVRDGSNAYSMADLPGAGYTQQGRGTTRSLSISWVERDSRGTDLTDYVGSARYTIEGREVEPEAVIAAMPAQGYAVVVSVSEEYFDQ